jgi:hypothetical protein
MLDVVSAAWEYLGSGRGEGEGLEKKKKDSIASVGTIIRWGSEAEKRVGGI